MTPARTLNLGTLEENVSLLLSHILKLIEISNRPNFYFGGKVSALHHGDLISTFILDGRRCPVRVRYNDDTRPPSSAKAEQ